MSTADRATPPAARPDGPLTALYLGFFATAWFSWADGTAPDGLSWWLRLGAYAGLAVAVAGAVGACTIRCSSVSASPPR